MTGLLKAEGLSRHFGGVYAVRDVSLEVGAGETCGVIGPNGAGKTTLFNLISGHLAPDEGHVELRGRRLDRLPPQARARRGIAIVFQDARVFAQMTVRENVMVGAHARTRAGFASAALRLPGHRRAERAIAEAADHALDRTGLSALADAPAEDLPLGAQRRLQLARALCTEPELLLLDEPASGLRGPERDALATLIEELKAEGVTMMLVEHDVAFVSRLADRIVVLDLGEVIAEGTPAEIREDPKVRTAYLGTTA